MKTKLPKNPFPTKNYIGRSFFCDRIDETKEIIRKTTNGNAISLIAMRRIGKTGLLKHIAESLPKTHKLTYIDILETNSMHDFLEKLTSSLLSEFPEKTRFGKKVWELIKSFRPTVSFNPLSGEPSASFSSNKTEPQLNIKQIFNYLESSEYSIIIAIDEFQQILQYKEDNVDAWFKTRMQEMKNVTFIFSGSQQHLMTDLFLNYDRPFYRSTQIIRLDKIDKEKYSQFIIRMFRRYNKTISKEITYEILDWTDTHTFYVQELCNNIFASDISEITSQDWKDEAYKLLKGNEVSFFTFREILSKQQWKLLTAIAANQPIYHPTSQDFIKRNDLGSSATILKALTVLMRVGLVYKDFEANGTKHYGVYDVYLRRWCETRR